MSFHTSTRLTLLALLALSLTACAGNDSVDDGYEGPQLAIGDEVPELGKALFDPGASMSAKEDTLDSAKGMPVAVDTGSAQVWAVTENWADTDTAAARKAGMAWSANSGLSWDEKYVAWVEVMERIDAESYGETFKMLTPYGKTLPGPALECAEAALFLRSTFASWYALPFYVTAGSGRNRVYMGHFGFLMADGSRYRSTPEFKKYRDYSNRADTWARDGWPSDSRLAKRKLGGSQDDYQPAIGPDARAGTYFDALYLNKRVGYFQVFLLSYFGSINLASPRNMYNLKPGATRAGDVLVKRYARTGIGHVYVVKHTERTEDSFEVELMSGSMPRRQPKWESAGSSKDALNAQPGGGMGENGDGDEYARIGGGIKRWRTPVKRSGYWRNIVPAADAETFIDAGDTATISARPGTFDQILGEVAPALRREILLEQIESSRMHLRNYPASCSARTKREDAFEKLYTLSQENFGQNTASVDARYRNLEDYALAELTYQKSKTCCWNRSTAAMYEIIMAKAVADTENHTAQACFAPTVFRAQDGGYEIFKAYADSIGRGDDWRAWSEDEGCPQRDSRDDLEAELRGSDFCEVGDRLGEGGAASFDGDDAEPNNTADQASAFVLGSGQFTVCAADEDFFEVSVGAGMLEVQVQFTHADGDIDLQLFDGAQRIGSSAGTDDSERITKRVSAGTYIIRVFPYTTGSTCQPYSLKVSSDG